MNGYNFDFLTLTVKDIEIKDFLGIVCESFPADFLADNFIYNNMGAVTGYNRSYRFLDEKYITISWWESSDGSKIRNIARESLCLRITGKGFRYLLLDDIHRLMTNLKECGIKYNITRLDVCYDDFTGKIPVEQLIQEFHRFQEGEYNVSTQISRESIKFFRGSFQKKSYTNLIVGTRQSKKMLRIYDKKAEQKDKEIERWERMEIQLNKGLALEFAEYWYETRSISQGFVDTINGMFRIIEENTKDSNVSRRKNKSWYDDFLGMLLCEKPIFCAELGS